MISWCSGTLKISWAESSSIHDVAIYRRVKSLQWPLRLRVTCTQNNVWFYDSFVFVCFVRDLICIFDCWMLSIFCRGHSGVFFRCCSYLISESPPNLQIIRLMNIWSFDLSDCFCIKFNLSNNKNHNNKNHQKIISLFISNDWRTLVLCAHKITFRNATLGLSLSATALTLVRVCI